MKNNIELNPHDLKGMRQLMDKYGNGETIFPGTNETGERVNVSIFQDRIVVCTFQSNNWIRKNTYHRDGSSEEAFER